MVGRRNSPMAVFPFSDSPEALVILASGDQPTEGRKLEKFFRSNGTAVPRMARASSGKGIPLFNPIGIEAFF